MCWHNNNNSNNNNNHHHNNNSTGSLEIYAKVSLNSRTEKLILLVVLYVFT
jgi:hypothetical protein